MDERRQLILGLDASQPSGSIALWESGSLIYSAYFAIQVTHSETLMPQIDTALRFCGLQPQHLGSVLLANGPGSFTGLRIGLATAKGMAYSLKCPLYAFNSLKLAALSRRGCGKKILSVIDARMKEIYAALWDEDLRPIIEPTICLPEDVLDWNVDAAWVIGNGAHLVPEAAHLYPVDSVGEGFIPAAGLYRLLMMEGLSGGYDFTHLANLEPFYLRDSSAQIKSARRAQNSK